LQRKKGRKGVGGRGRKKERVSAVEEEGKEGRKW
jgi:hypothetical protein